MSTREQWLAETFVELTDYLVDDRDLDDFLRRLAERSAELLGGGVAAILLADRAGHLELRTLSPEHPQIARHLTADLPDSPCRTAFRTLTPLINVRLDGDRWPEFAEGAVRHGFSMVHVVPLRRRDQALGTLEVLHREARPVAPPDDALFQTFADLAATAILNHRAMERATTLAGQLQFALDSRVVIEQAKGLVAEHLQVGVGEAFTHLRSYSRRRSLRLVDVAREVLEGSLKPADLLPPGADDG